MNAKYNDKEVSSDEYPNVLTIDENGKVTFDNKFD